MSVYSQSNLFSDNIDLVPRIPKPINVASVPHRSPFRYPGGKTWFVPTARKWQSSHFSQKTILLEPFAGGAIVGLSAIFEQKASKLVLSETDPQVAAVWKVIFSQDNEWLCRKILSFEVSTKSVRDTLDRPARSIRDLAFSTIIRNRMQHGGIMAPGASLMKNGESGKGLHSRWYPDTLAKRIRALSTIQDRVTFVQSDGIALLEKFQNDPNAAAFIDPPYTASKKSAGNRLYSHHTLDHDELFRIASVFAGPVVMTYDDSDEVVQLANKYNLKIKRIAMRNRRNSEMLELVIGNDLSWL